MKPIEYEIIEIIKEKGTKKTKHFQIKKIYTILWGLLRIKKWHKIAEAGYAGSWTYVVCLNNIKECHLVIDKLIQQHSTETTRSLSVETYPAY